MREIKFQLYDRKLQMMFDVTEISSLDHSEGFVKGRKGDSGGEYYVTSGYLGKRIGLGPNGTAPIVNRFALREYTGLKDKNGVDICEGDIVSSFVPNRESTGAIIDYDDEITVFSDIRNANEQFVYLVEPRIIGNIYENPELLER